MLNLLVPPVTHSADSISIAMLILDLIKFVVLIKKRQIFYTHIGLATNLNFEMFKILKFKFFKSQEILEYLLVFRIFATMYVCIMQKYIINIIYVHIVIPIK